MRPELSISIVNWNTRDLLRECLNSIYSETTGISFEVFVVDNASSDGSAEMVSQEFPTVNLICNQNNSGFGRANNQALKRCQGEYILFLNPDTQIVANAIIKIIDFMKKNPRVGVAGPKTIHPDGTIQVSWASFPSLATIFTNNVPLNMALPVLGIYRKLFKTDAIYSNQGFSIKNVTESRKVDYLLGEFLLTRKSILDTVGGFPEDIFMYEEETDLCYRIYKQGWEIWLVAEAQIIHHEKRSIKQLPDQIKKEVDWFITGRSRFFKKYNGTFKMILFHIFNLLNAILKFAMYKIMYLVDTHRRSFISEKVKFQSQVIAWYWRKLVC